MLKNLRLSLLVFSLTSAYFWFGVWVPYYLKFTTYAGIGIAEALSMILAFSIEIPTGALADTIGKKKTLQLSFLFLLLGELIMILAANFYHLIAAVLVIAVSGALSSGTREAFIYDSLKQVGKENTYDTIQAKINKHSLIVMAIASVLGGFLYKVDPRLPFLLTGLTGLAALVVSFFLEEPKMDTEKASLKTYIKQNFEGFKQLFKKGNNLGQILILLAVTSFIYFLSYGLDAPLALYFGLDERGLGIIFAIGVLAAAVGNHYYSSFRDRLGKERLLFLIFVTTVITTLFSPFIGLSLGVIGLVYRHFFYTIPDIVASDTINKSVESKYSATTLSTFVMLHNLPYVIAAYFVGKIIDSYSAGIVTMLTTIIFSLLLLFVIVFNKIKSITSKHAIAEQSQNRAQKIAEARRVGTFGKLSVKAPRRPVPSEVEGSKRARRPTVPCRSFSEGGANTLKFDIFCIRPAIFAVVD